MRDELSRKTENIGYDGLIEADYEIIAYNDNGHSHLPAHLYHFFASFHIASYINILKLNIIFFEIFLGQSTKMASRCRINFYFRHYFDIIISMDQEVKDTLRKVLELEQKNHSMLLSIKRSIFWTRVFTILYWIVIIGAAIGAYYYLQPYIDQVLATYGSFKGSIEQVKNAFVK